MSALELRRNPLCAPAGGISRRYRIDLFVDIATIVLFAAATLKPPTFLLPTNPK
jgi:hypothetical protein